MEVGYCIARRCRGMRSSTSVPFSLPIASTTFQSSRTAKQCDGLAPCPWGDAVYRIVNSTDTRLVNVMSMAINNHSGMVFESVSLLLFPAWVVERRVYMRLCSVTTWYCLARRADTEQLTSGSDGHARLIGTTAMQIGIVSPIICNCS